MTWQELLPYTGSAAVIGGFIGTAISTVLTSRFIAKHKAVLDRDLERMKSELTQETERLKSDLAKDTETHKLRLKKQEVLYGKLFEAASAFMEIRRNIQPTSSHPSMEWEEAMEIVVQDFTRSSQRIRDFLVKHGAALSSSVRKMLEDARQIAENNKFAEFEGVTKQSLDEADYFLKKLVECEEQMLSEINP